MSREQHLLLNVPENSDGKTLELFQENIDSEAKFFSNDSDGTSFCNIYFILKLYWEMIPSV